jgi:hypothetical protein
MISKKMVSLALAGALSLSTHAAAQCPSPDRLDGGPCCTIVKARIPALRQFSHPSLDLCWRDCNLEQVMESIACWDKPMAVGVATPTGVAKDCGRFTIRLRLKNTAGLVKWRGRLGMTYARTWMEAAPGGALYQVWRFLLNGDLIPMPAAGPIPCPVPPCAPAHMNRVRYTGYIDYAKDCATNQFSHAWMLTHACDLIDHHPGFPRAGAFHPDRSYTFVGPSAGFAPGPFQPIEVGGSMFEDVRRLNLPVAGSGLPLTCEYEERINFGTQLLQQGCLCGAPPTPQWANLDLSLAGVCGTSITTVPHGPFLPGYLTMGIGSWTIPGVFPGVERLRWNVADYDYLDPCTLLTRQEVFFGVTTFDGYPAFQVLTGAPGLPLPPIFIDQANSLLVFGGTTMNEPFVSDHILNLNM